MDSAAQGPRPPIPETLFLPPRYDRTPLRPVPPRQPSKAPAAKPAKKKPSGVPAPKPNAGGEKKQRQSSRKAAEREAARIAMEAARIWAKQEGVRLVPPSPKRTSRPVYRGPVLRGDGVAAKADRRYGGESVRTVSGGLPTLGRHR